VIIWYYMASCITTVAIETYNQSLEGMISDQGDCLKIWVAFCDYMRRRVSSAASSSPSHPPSSPSQPSNSGITNGSTSEIEELRSTFNRAREYMKTSVLVLTTLVVIFYWLLSMVQISPRDLVTLIVYCYAIRQDWKPVAITTL